LDDGVARYLGPKQCDKHIQTLPFSILHVYRLFSSQDSRLLEKGTVTQAAANSDSVAWIPAKALS
jgi:hypothetical protein